MSAACACAGLVVGPAWSRCGHDVGVIKEFDGVGGAERAVVRARALVRRLPVVVSLSVVAIPILALSLYLMWWWLPALSGPGVEPCDPAVDGWGVCWRPEQRMLWIAGAASSLLGGGCLLMSLTRLRRAGRWWPWPLASMGLLAGGLWTLGQIS